MLDILNIRCKCKCLQVNLEKTKIVHFRNPSVTKSNRVFLFDGKKVDIQSKYMYLGLLLTEHLDYNEMTKTVARSASRALSLLIVKSKAHGGFQFQTFTKLFDTLVWSVITYGAAIWGTRDFSCINAVQNRAIRFYMGVGKYTPNDAINGDMGWKPPCVKLWSCVLRHWSRLSNMNVQRINFKVFKWSYRYAVNRKNNWCERVMSKLKENNFDFYIDINNVLSKGQISDFEDILFEKYKLDWQLRMSAK